MRLPGGLLSRRRSKIADFELAEWADEDILWLHVPMDEPHTMNLLGSADELPHHLADHVLGQGPPHGVAEA